MNPWARPLPTRVVKAEVVLERLNQLRHCGVYCDDTFEGEFTAEMTLDAWMEAVGWDEVVPLEELNCAFGTMFDWGDWSQVGAMASTTLGEVCAWVAKRTTWEYVEPLQIAGTESYEAGVFLAILHLLERSGIDTRGIRPSDELLPWLISHSNRLLPELRRLFPIDLPETVDVRHPLTRAGRAMCLRECLALIVAAIGAWIAQSAGLLLTSLIGLAFSIGSIRIGERLLPSHYEFAEVNTFRDLARWIAASQRRPGDRLRMTHAAA